MARHLAPASHSNHSLAGHTASELAAAAVLAIQPQDPSANGLANLSSPGKRGRGRPRKDSPSAEAQPHFPDADSPSSVTDEKKGRGRPRKTDEQKEQDRVAREAAKLVMGDEEQVEEPKPKKQKMVSKKRELVPKPIEAELPPILDENGAEIAPPVEVKEGKRKRGRPLGTKNKEGHTAGRPKKDAPPRVPKPKVSKGPVGRPRKVGIGRTAAKKAAAAAAATVPEENPLNGLPLIPEASTSANIYEPPQLQLPHHHDDDGMGEGDIVIDPELRLNYRLDPNMQRHQ